MNVSIRENDEEKIYKGTYKHVHCKGVTSEGGNICTFCESIPELGSFRKRILLRASITDENGNRDTNKIRFDYLTQTEKAIVLKQKSEENNKLRSKLFFMKSKALRNKIQVLTLREKLKEFSVRGDMKAICQKLTSAQEKGLLNDKKIFLDILETVSRNLGKSSKGNRYVLSTKNFYEALLIMGGPKIANFVSMNIEGPNLNTIYHWRNLNKIRLCPGIDSCNFSQYAKIVGDIMEKCNIGKVPVLAAEDETAIVASVRYNQNGDELLGFCGPKTANESDHKCLTSNHIIVGNDADAYNRIVTAFSDNKIGSSARVIILNPLHENIPRLIVLLMPTCNRFTHKDVYAQWQNIQRQFEESLEGVIGPLIGHSSDGDSRRRKLQLQLGMCDAGDRFQPIPAEFGFFLNCRREENLQYPASYTIRELGDQDAIHNHKKIINHLDHTKRVLTIGQGLLVHMNHVSRVIQEFPALRHGLSQEHLKRDRDRQNWKIAQELTFNRVQECLTDIVNGHAGSPPDETVNGTRAFLYVVSQYVEIFFSVHASLTERIEAAGFVTHFLGIWRNYIYRHPQLTLSSNFLSRETYSDILISTHFSVMLICFFRDNFPDQMCRLDRTGSDCCEEYFSKNGQFVGNQRVYTYSQMYLNLSHMIRLNQIEADNNAPAFAKAHIKQENIWHKHVGGNRCTLTDYPAPGEELEAWLRGRARARTLARELGMGPGDGGDDDNDDPGNPWFYNPFDNCDHDKVFRCLSGDPLNGQDNADGDRDDDYHDSDDDDDNDGRDGGGDGFDGDNDGGDLGGGDCEDIQRRDDNCEQGGPFNVTPEESEELFNTLHAAVDAHEGEPEIRCNRGVATVDVPGHGKQYKSTLVRLLNEDPKLSHDRLVRVRQTNHVPEAATGRSKGTVNHEHCHGLSLFEDYTYVDTSIPDSSFKVGRLQRIQRRFDKRMTDYKETVPFSADYLKDVTVTFVEYDREDQITFKMNPSTCTLRQINATAVIGPANLVFNNNKFIMFEETVALNENACTIKTSTSRTKKAVKKPQANDDFDGRFVETVQPQMHADGRRSSQRTRKQIHFSS